METKIQKSTATAFVVGLALGVLIGTQLTTQSLTPECNAPAGLGIKIDTILPHVYLRWDTLGNVASQYDVHVLDTSGHIVYNRTVYTPFDTLRTLEADQEYRIEIRKPCGEGLSAPLIGTFNTLDWIISEDVVHLSIPERGNEICAGECNNHKAGVGGINFAWGGTATSREMYHIEIKSGASTLAHAALEKDFTSGAKKVVSHVNLTCNDASQNTLKEPTKSGCTPMMPQQFCGKFDDGGVEVAYEVTFNSMGCSVRFPGGGTYDVIVRVCTL